ncbi:MAG: hypothetical protein SFV54_02110 [Bryobacteraceae bacterium]|nr:hypothetical protein [Bryobacteraceae bacterium]
MAGEPIFIIDVAPNGIIATHPQRAELPVLVAPIPIEQRETNFNAIRDKLVAIGCMRLPNTGFAFDSSFISPESADAFTRFARLMLKLRDAHESKQFPPCSVFAHADPTGDDGYNKILSGRRALALYGLLIRKPEIWDELFTVGHGGDQWGTKSFQTMLSQSLATDEPPFYTGPIDGALTPQTQKATRDAISAWRESRGFGKGFNLDKKMRLALFLEYMNAICKDPDGNNFELTKDDFIARGAEKSLRGDVQGCGEFNPIFLFSQEKTKAAKKDKTLEAVRNELYVVDRRALVFVFKHGTRIDPAKWPCPAARERPDLCAKRFWSDGDKRRKEGPEDRTFGDKMTILAVDETNTVTPRPVEETGNTMACRFYHGFAQHSPCERKLREWVVRLRIDGAGGEKIPLSNRRYVVKAGEAEFAPLIRGTTDDKGELRIPVIDERTKMTIKIDATGLDMPQPEGNDPGADTDKFAGEEDFWPLIVDGGALRERDVGDDAAVKQRLYNLGFGENAPDKWTQEEFDEAFKQFRHRNNLDNEDDNTVRAAIFDEHEIKGATPPPSEQTEPEPQES